MNTFTKISIAVFLALAAIGTYESFFLREGVADGPAYRIAVALGLGVLVVLAGAWVIMLVLLVMRGYYEDNVGQAKTLFDYFISHRHWQFEPTVDSVTIRPRHFTSDPLSGGGQGKNLTSSVSSTVINGRKIWMVFEKYTYLVNYEKFFSWKFYFITHFSRHIPGFVQFGPEDTFSPKLKKDLELESIEYNKQVFILSKPAKLVWQALPPDFMDWYLQLKNKPWVTIEKGVCSIDIRERPTLMLIDQSIDRMIAIANFIEHSGALRK